MSAGFCIPAENIKKSIVFTMPEFPVPLSSCFVNVRRNGRADSPRYKLWKMATDVALRGKRGLCGKLGKPTLSGPVVVSYEIHRPDNRARDLDNLFKACNDTLTRNHIIEDDSLITDLRIRWTDDQFDGAVRVQITQG